MDGGGLHNSPVRRTVHRDADQYKPHLQGALDHKNRWHLIRPGAIAMALGGRRLTLVSLLAAVTISGGIFGWTGFGSDLATYASSAGTVSVIETTHRVEFPHRFVLTLEARAPSDIESARVFYTIGDAPVSVYAYPTKLSHRGNLSAEFEIQTGSAGVHSPGSRRRVLLRLHGQEWTNDSLRTLLVRVPGPQVQVAATGAGRLHPHVARHARDFGPPRRRRCLCAAIPGSSGCSE